MMSFLFLLVASHRFSYQYHLFNWNLRFSLAVKQHHDRPVVEHVQ